MKNTELYPFERNKYYYGMLLSVEDFNSEQKYMNDKRRLVNRLVHGVGVVSGLNVVAIDDQTISVESGLAFDSTGREIIVDPPVTKKLSMINGYSSAMSSGSNAYVYLCLEYSEGEKGTAYDLASGGGEAVHDKIKEGYNLYLTCSEPDDSIDPVRDIYEQSTTIYSDAKLRIRHVIPRFVNPDSQLELRVEIETFTKQYASFSYELQLICLTDDSDGDSVLRVNFNEMLFEKKGRYTLSYRLNSGNVVNAQGSAKVEPSSFTLAYDKLPTEASASGTSETFITKGDISEAVISASYGRDMDSLFRSALSRRLYLARIDLVNAGESSIIESVTNVPFGQYVINNDLQNALRRLSAPVSVQAPVKAGTENAQLLPKASERDITGGVCRIDLSSGSLKNKVFYSEEITHGLGLGSVSILLGIKTKTEGTVFGDSEIFKDDVPAVKLAAKLDPSKGSFVIGVMTASTVLEDYLDIRWTAFRDIDENVGEKSRMKLMIKPNSLVIKPRETRYLEAVCQNMTNKTVRWSVSPETGGDIDANGLYTAPNTEGVYEVIAQSAIYPELKASIMVVVRD